MRQSFPWGIGSRLIALAFANAVALALIAVIVWLAYGRIEGLSTEIAHKEMTGVFANAALGREVAIGLSDLDAAIRGCHYRNGNSGETGRIDAQLAALAGAAADPALAESIAGLALTTQHLLGKCGDIGANLDAIAGTEGYLLDQLAALDQLTSRALIDQTLAEKSTDYLDQVMALTIGYRESILLIGREIGQAAANSESVPASAEAPLAMVDDLKLQLQAMAAATPEMAAIAQRMIGAVEGYRVHLVALQTAQGEFETILQAHRTQRDRVLAELQRLDQETDHRAGHFLAELHGIVARTASQVLWIGAAIALASLLLAIGFVRRNLQRPLSGVLEHIAQIRGGAPAPATATRDDEWGAIQSALSDMAARLSQTHGLLRDVINTAPIRVFWKDRDCRYLGCNPVFARDAGKQSPAELIGRDDYAMGWAEQADLYRADDQQVMASGQARLDFEEPQTNPDGKLIWLRTSKVPLRDAAGTVIGVLGIYDDITERKQAESALLSEKQFSADALNALPGVFYMFDATGRFVRWNHHFNQVSGYTDAELATMRATDFFTGEDQRRVGAAVQRVFAQGQAEVEADIQTKDGRKLPYHFQGQRSTSGDQTYLLGVGLDISEQRRTRQALEIERTHLHTLVSTIPDLIWLKAVDGTYLACNPEFERFVGAAESDILGKTDYDLVPSALADSFREHDRAAIAAGKASRNEEWLTYASDGRRVLLETTRMQMRTPDGRLVGVLGIGHDITERKLHQEQLEHLAHFDNLTGLPNRVLLADRLHQAMLQARRRETLVAIAFLDLDGFKAINDQYGHKAGDQLLTTLSGHMKQLLREGDTLARVGGDEFLVVLIDLPDVESSAPLLARLLAVAAAVVDYEGNALRVSASLGVTFYPQAEAIDADQLLRQADQAMYQAKQAGKNRYHIFDTEQDRHVRGHHESLERIRRALDEREFVLYYQPKANMRSGVVIGAEALVRWQHPERGLLPPADFLPLIADHPLAIAIGEWVLDTAMRQIETWKAAGLALPVSVNIDAIQLEQADFVQRLRQQVAAHPRLAAGDLELEVLETSALQNTAYATGVILACREMGVGFALDDFGTGYSSLTYLRRLPVGLLKIDQSFVRDMLDDPDDLAMLNGILGLASAFRIPAIAEGVETLVHGKILLQLGCELAQGYAIARPMPAEDLPVWLAAWRPPSSWLNQAPISRDDLPILFAWVEHRAWIIKVASFIRGEGDTPPQMHPEQCRVGQWLKAEARLPKEHHLAVEALGPYHNEIHELASELIRLKRDGRMDAAMAKLPELDRLRERFLAQVMEMLPDRSADPACVNPSPA